ncbi:MAG: TonB family protein [Candidatus Omnitrophota bacterium]
MVKRLVAAMGVCFLCFSCATIFSQNILDKYDEEVTLIVGEAYVIPVASPQRVSMRNPDVSDIGKVSDTEIVIVAKQAGDTALTVWDKEGEKVFYITVYAHDVDRIFKRLEKLIRKDLKIPNVVLKKNQASGTVIITGDVTSLDKEQIDKILEPFKEKVENILTVKKETKMVEIEARILEINKTELDKLGVQWMEYIQIRQEPYKAPSADQGVTTTLDRRSASANGFWGFGKFSKDAITAKINLLITSGKGKELSRPKLLCLSGEEAKLTVGGEVPYLSSSTASAVGTTISIAYKEYGVILKMRPIVSLDSKKIFASLRAEVSALDWENGVVVSGIKIPAFATRVAETVVNLQSGDTVFIAGLIKSKDSEGLQKFPALGNLPVIGNLFRSKEFQNNQTELVISLTPKVVQPDEKEDLMETTEIADKKIMDVYSGIIPSQLQGYIVEIEKMISGNLSYPASLMNTGWEGMVVLQLDIFHTGDIKNVKVSKTSGHRIFDSDAIKLVKSLSFPPFPPDVGVEELNIEIPIVYRERNK